MTTARIAVIALIAVLVLGGSALAELSSSGGDDEAIGAIDLRKDDAAPGEELVADEDDDRDGDPTEGDDGTAGGNDTGRDGDDTRGNDGTAGGNDTGNDGDDTTGKDGTRGGNDTGRDGDDTTGNDGSAGGENTAVASADDGVGFAPAPAGGGSYSGGGSDG